MTNLQKQVYIYSLGTFAFHNEEENELHKRRTNLKGYKNRLTKDKTKLKKSEKELKSSVEDRKVKSAKRKQIKVDRKGINDEIKLVSQEIESLKDKLYEAFDNHTGIRTLREDELNKGNVISIFDSVLTRTLGMEGDEPLLDIMVIQSYHKKVLEGLIKDGFMYGNHHYIYFSSSAGQIRQEKGVWIRSDLWNKHKGSLTCGLDVEEVNAKGGCNTNKYLSYKALINSASEEWVGFDIDRCIVVDDLELNVEAKVDYIHRDTFKIERKTMDIPMTVTDGVGMILPDLSKKNFMIRLPFVKGLLAVYDFRKHGTIVKDIDGRKRDIIKEDIQIIFTKSQWKMHKYFDSWEDYKQRFKEYNCQAAKLNEEEEDLNEGKLGYQMLQSLTDVTDKELKDIAASTLSDINSLGSSQEVMMKVLGATEANERKSNLQRCLMMYPVLLNDAHSKRTIKSKKASLIGEAKTGKLNVSGSFVYIIPDLYSFSEYLFKGEAKSLLKKNEVYHRLHDSGQVAILRSPHLSREWGIRNNVRDVKKSHRFTTDAIYVSNEDILSKLIMNDFDGDKVLVLSEHKDKTLFKVAKRNMENDDIVPMHYEMEKAPAQDINPNSIYDSLILAFEANIGEISNNATKVWNSDEPNLDVLRWLCMISNYEIDYAKTLFRLPVPPEVEIEIKQYINTKMPYFMKFDKRKNKRKNGTKKDVRTEEKNNSTVNRLGDIIKTKNISFRKIAGGALDYTKLMKNPDVELDQAIIDRYTELDRNKKDYIKPDGNKKKGRKYIYTYIRSELLKINPDAIYITDVLIKHLYEAKNSEYKDTLWESFGWIIERNLKVNLLGTVECIKCNEVIEEPKQRQVRCDCCQAEWKREKARERKQKQREKERMSRSV